MKISLGLLLLSVSFAVLAGEPLKRSEILDKIETLNSEIKALQNEKTGVENRFPGKIIGWRYPGSDAIRTGEKPKKGKIITVREGDDEAKKALEDIAAKMEAKKASVKELKNKLTATEK